MGYPNYPVRCVCFALVGVLFLLPVIFLVVSIFYPLPLPFLPSLSPPSSSPPSPTSPLPLSSYLSPSPLKVTVNQPKLDEHVQWRESNCTLNSNVPPQMCFGLSSPSLSLSLSPSLSLSLPSPPSLSPIILSNPPLIFFFSFLLPPHFHNFQERVLCALLFWLTLRMPTTLVLPLVMEVEPCCL